MPLEPVVKIHHKLAIILDHKILLTEPPSSVIRHSSFSKVKTCPDVEGDLQSCTSDKLTSRYLNFAIMVSVWSIWRRNIRRQQTASVKDFSSDTSKKEITAPKIDKSILTTVLLTFPGCWFLQTCHNRVSKVVSCFNLETVAACPNFRSRLPLCETNKLTNKTNCQHFSWDMYSF